MDPSCSCCLELLLDPFLLWTPFVLRIACEAGGFQSSMVVFCCPAWVNLVGPPVRESVPGSDADC